MNMYEAVKAAAAHIGARPHHYSFQITDIPADENERGCILGRIAQLVGFQTKHANLVAESLLGVNHMDFFGRVLSLMAPEQKEAWVGPTALDCAALVAPALLRYAERYRAELEMREWPPGAIPAIPKSVREIFNPQVFDGLFIGAGVGGSMPPPTQAAPAGCKYSISLDQYVPA